MLDNNNFGFWGGGSGGGGGGGGTVTAVGLCMPPAFAVSNSPITTAGNLCVQGAGLASQYIRGDGTLADFPSVGGGAGSQIFYFNGGVSQGTIGGQASFQMSKTANVGAAANFPIIGNGLMAQFITDIGSPNQILIPAGAWQFSTYLSSSNNTGSPQVYAVISKWDGTTLTTIATSANEVITNGTAVDLYNFTASLSETVLLATDRIVVTFYTTNTGGRTITLYTQSTNLSDVTTTFPNGISSLNGLTANTQFFQTTSCGTDFGIVSSGNTHCFNLPTASCTNRGALSAADYACFYNYAVHTWNPTGWTVKRSILAQVDGLFNSISTAINSDCYNAILSGGNNNLSLNTVGSAQSFNVITGGGSNIMTARQNFSPVEGNLISGGSSNNIDARSFCHNTISGGQQNTICGFCLCGNAIGGGFCNSVFNSVSGQVSNNNFIGGGSTNAINNNCNSAILGGFTNCITNNFGVALGGQCNTVTGLYSGVANLCGVNASAACTFYFCNICALGTISGGGVSPVYCFGASSSIILPVNGGNSNASPCSVISGGVGNSISTSVGTNNAIGGGASNGIATLGNPVYGSGIFSGESNFMANYNSVAANMNYNFIGGGTGNGMQNPSQGRNTSWGVIGGGQNNTLSNACYMTIAGGSTNAMSWSNYSFIGGGASNSMGGFVGTEQSYSGIVTGQSNSISSSPYSFIGGGSCNTINVGSGSYSSILGGATNCITQSFASILGGNNNSVSSIYGVALGGQCNTVTGCYAGAFGCGINASVANTFYFCHLCLLGNFRNGGSVQLAGIANSVAGGNILYFDNTTKCVAFGGLTSGTAAPTGGVDGDIYLQYV